MAETRLAAHCWEVYIPDENKWVRMCDAFGIDEVKVDLLSGEHRVVLFVDSPRSGRNQLEVGRETIQQRSVMAQLYKLGFSHPDTLEELPGIQELLLDSEQAAAVRYYHRKLGFQTLKTGEEIFLLDRPVGLTDPVRAESRYHIPEVLEPRGTLDDWLALMEKEVIGKPKMELALAVGCVAPVAHLLRKARIIQDLPIIAFIGHSSTGKSASLRVGASCWGLPLEGEGIIDNLNSTENAFYASLCPGFH